MLIFTKKIDLEFIQCIHFHSPPPPAPPPPPPPPKKKKKKKKDLGFKMLTVLNIFTIITPTNIC